MARQHHVHPDVVSEHPASVFWPSHQQEPLLENYHGSGMYDPTVPNQQFDEAALSMNTSAYFQDHQNQHPEFLPPHSTPSFACPSDQIVSDTSFPPFGFEETPLFRNQGSFPHPGQALPSHHQISGPFSAHQQSHPHSLSTQQQHLAHPFQIQSSEYFSPAHSFPDSLVYHTSDSHSPSAVVQPTYSGPQRLSEEHRRFFTDLALERKKETEGKKHERIMEPGELPDENWQILPQEAQLCSFNTTRRSFPSTFHARKENILSLDSNVYDPKPRTASRPLVLNPMGGTPSDDHYLLPPDQHFPHNTFVPNPPAILQSQYDFQHLVPSTQPRHLPDEARAALYANVRLQDQAKRKE
ncbi:hypothetical protein JCM5350_004681, partial [Sporobolomyces pararoseus]